MSMRIRFINEDNDEALGREMDQNAGVKVIQAVYRRAMQEHYRARIKSIEFSTKADEAGRRAFDFLAVLRVGSAERLCTYRCPIDWSAGGVERTTTALSVLIEKQLLSQPRIVDVISSPVNPADDFGKLIAPALG